MRQRQLDVAGARRHVDHQVIQIIPAGVVEQLLQRLADHGAAPDHGLVRVHQITDGHGLHAVAFQRLQAFAVRGFRALTLQAHHQRLRWAIDVGVQNADARAFRGQRQRQVGRGGGFADAALAGGNGDHVLDAGKQRHAALGGVAGDQVAHAHAKLALLGQRRQRGLEALADGFVLAVGRIGQHHVQRQFCIADLDVFHRLGGDEGFAGVVVDQAGHGFQHLRIAE